MASVTISVTNIENLLVLGVGSRFFIVMVGLTIVINFITIENPTIDSIVVFIRLILDGPKIAPSRTEITEPKVYQAKKA